jgi:mannose-6-phosphate isomerase-like protein (cupin superfamily)
MEQTRRAQSHFLGYDTMDELEEGLDISVKGPLREEALEQFRRQVGAWGLTMPPAGPLVLDFGLGEFWETGLIECWIANETEAGYCGKYLFVFEDQTCPTHHHRQKMETFHVVKGHMRITVEGEPKELAEGWVLPVRPGQRHSFSGLDRSLLLELSQPCVIADNYFEDERIPIGGQKEDD